MRFLRLFMFKKKANVCIIKHIKFICLKQMKQDLLLLVLNIQSIYSVEVSPGGSFETNVFSVLL